MSPSLLKRFFCGLYELLLLIGLLMLAGFLLVPLGRGLHLSAEDSTWFTRIWVLTLITTYFCWFWTHGGQTLPMKTWRVRLIMANGQPLSFSIALFRLLLLISGFGVGGIHLLWAIFDRDRQCLHDRLLGTRLVLIEPQLKNA